MTTPTRRTNSSRRSRKSQQMKTWFLGLLVLAMAGLILAGPKLFAQGETQPRPAPTVEQPEAEAPPPPPTEAAPEAPPADPEAAPAAPPPTEPEAAPATTETAQDHAASGHGEAVKLPFGTVALLPLFIVFAAALLALAFGAYWWKKTMAHDPGSERMQGVSAAVQEGAMAYLSRQVKTMTPLVLIIGTGLFFLYKQQYSALGGNMAMMLGLGVAAAFVLGVTASYLAGYVGMGVAVRANTRVAHAALSSFKNALEIAFQAGAVSGMFTVGLGLLGATITFLVFKENAMFVLVGFGFGGSLAALFMRVGGGIFTIAADVGADLVGKVEAGIPEDDPRNAATIADNVGDNVGDCAGMAADVFESYEVTLVAAIILAAAVGSVLQGAGFGGMLQAGSFTYEFTLSLIVYSLLVRAIGVIASIVGVMAVKGRDDLNMNPMNPINTGFLTSALIATIGFAVVAFFVFGPGRSQIYKNNVSEKAYNYSKYNKAFDFSKEAFRLPAAALALVDETMEQRAEQEAKIAEMPADQQGMQRMMLDMQFPLPKDEDVAKLPKAVEAMLETNPKIDLTMAGLNDLVKEAQPIMTKDQKVLTADEKKIKKQVDTLQNEFGPAMPQWFNALGLRGMDSFLQGAKDHVTLASSLKDHFWWLAFLATFIGIVLTQLIGKLTEYFTAEDKKPVTEIASSAKTGPATLILAGLSEGLESSVWAILCIAVTIVAAFMLFPNPAMAAYAIALVGLGLLATTGYVLAMDTYGPISDNANGIFEMSGALKNADGSENADAHHIVARLDMVGNTTKALTKGFAIATAVIAAVALYRSYLDTVAVHDPSILVKNIQVNMPDVFVGLMIGGAVPFLFSSFAIRAVSRAAVQLVEEVRRQFRTIPGIWEYTGVGEKGKPDYARCVAISTAAAQRELLGPGLLAVFAPILVGFTLGAYALGGFLAGAILVGQLMAVFMSNTGGAWDNAKKKIEDGFLGGKGSEAHKAGVIGDTVGDPLKDTAGPALNPMIKVMNLVAILVAPGTVILADSPYKWLVGGIAFLVLCGAVFFSKRGGVVAETSTEENSSATIAE